MEDDNRVYARSRRVWRALDPGCALGETPPDGWPLVARSILRRAEIIVWRGKLLKDRWKTFDRDEFLMEIRGL
jgi:hypothetical protein